MDNLIRHLRNYHCIIRFLYYINWLYKNILTRCTMTKPKPKKAKVRHYTGADKKYYDLLMKTREQISGRMQVRLEGALNSDNLDKRGVTTHMADVSSDSLRNELEMQLLTKDGSVLEMIELALERLSNNEYGNCLDCNERISEARLEYRPYALYCINCKSIREKNNGRNPNVE